MNLISGKPFWPEVNKNYTYPQLDHDISCDVAIIGGGISGALIAFYLTKAQIDCVVVEKRGIGMGSTSGSTALLEYELDKNLSELIPIIGEKKAVEVYRLSRSSILKLDKISQVINEHKNFEHKKSLYLASSKKDVPKITKEYEVRKKYGFRVRLLDRNTLKKYNVNSDMALLSYESAQLDPFRFTQKIIKHLTQDGLRVYEKTTITNYETNKRDISLVTNRGHKLKAKKIVFATGYESQNFLPHKIVKFTTDYALVSEPMTKKQMGCLNLYTVWETAPDYLYASTTGNRIMVGLSGLKYDGIEKRQILLQKKKKEIIRRFSEFFPKIKFRVANVWAGTFGVSKDSMPYIGELQEFPDAYFALGYGGNGIAFSTIAAEIIRDKLLGKRVSYYDIFKFDR